MSYHDKIMSHKKWSIGVVILLVLLLFLLRICSVNDSRFLCVDCFYKKRGGPE